MTQQRWWRIIPVALIMYTISYIDRTNISLAFEPKISSLMHDLLMDDRMKGRAAGIFFIGYILLQLPGGHFAARWSPRKIIAICLVMWGAFAVGCGLAKTFRQFEIMRFCLGVAESAVFPATTVLMTNWFPSSERARANAYWGLCQPLAVAGSAPLTGWLLGAYGWRQTLILEGILPFIWLPIWWFCIRDHPREATWVSPEERAHLEKSLREEAVQPSSATTGLSWLKLIPLVLLLLLPIDFLHNFAAYGCMTFFTSAMNERAFTGFQHGLLLALPYAITAVLMVLNSWHSDKTRERRYHIAVGYAISGISLIASVSLKSHFWLSYAFLCLAIPGPFAVLALLFAIPTEVLPRNLMGLTIGLVNAIGNLGGFAGPYVVGWLKQQYQSTNIPFTVLGCGLLLAAVLSLFLPKSPRA